MNAQPTLPEPAYKILIATTFEPTADAALYEAIALSRKTSGAELHAVHVLTDPGNERVAAAARRTEAVAEQLRSRIEAAWQHAGEIRVTAHLRAGDAAASILRTAIEIDADVIVVGSHRRTGLRKLILGSVAERVLHEAHCPVLIAVPKDYAAIDHVAAACADCLSARAASANARFWCERHDRPSLRPHVYVPREDGRSSLLSTY
jgi:nucleotide-binding universal stress UspA family protein